MTDNVDMHLKFYVFYHELRRMKIKTLTAVNQKGISHHFTLQQEINQENQKRKSDLEGEKIPLVNSIVPDEQIFVPMVNQRRLEYSQLETRRLASEVIYNLKIPILQNWFYELDYTEEAKLLFGTDITFYTEEFINQLKQSYRTVGYSNKQWRDMDGNTFTNDVNTTNKWIFPAIVSDEVVISFWFNDGSDLREDIRNQLLNEKADIESMRLMIGDRNSQFIKRVKLQESFNLPPEQIQEYVTPTFLYSWSELLETVGNIHLPLPFNSAGNDATEPEYIRINYASLSFDERESITYPEVGNFTFLFFKGSAPYSKVTIEQLDQNRRDFNTLMLLGDKLTNQQIIEVMQGRISKEVRNIMEGKSSPTLSAYDRMSPEQQEQADDAANKAMEELLKFEEQNTKKETPEERKDEKEEKKNNDRKYKEK